MNVFVCTIHVVWLNVGLVSLINDRLSCHVKCNDFLLSRSC